jgi:hypothetical protein
MLKSCPILRLTFSLAIVLWRFDGVQGCFNRCVHRTIPSDGLLFLFGVENYFGRLYLNQAVFKNVDLSELPVQRLSFKDLRFLLEEYCKIEDSKKAVELIKRRNERISIELLAIKHPFFRSNVIPKGFAFDAITAEECVTILQEYEEFSIFQALNWIQKHVKQEPKVKEFVSCLLLGGEHSNEEWRSASGIRIPF